MHLGKVKFKPIIRTEVFLSELFKISLPQVFILKIRKARVTFYWLVLGGTNQKNPDHLLLTILTDQVTFSFLSFCFIYFILDSFLVLVCYWFDFIAHGGINAIGYVVFLFSYHGSCLSTFGFRRLLFCLFVWFCFYCFSFLTGSLFLLAMCHRSQGFPFLIYSFIFSVINNIAFDMIYIKIQIATFIWDFVLREIQRIPTFLMYAYGKR